MNNVVNAQELTKEQGEALNLAFDCCFKNSVQVPDVFISTEKKERTAVKVFNRESVEKRIQEIGEELKRDEESTKSLKDFFCNLLEGQAEDIKEQPYDEEYYNDDDDDPIQTHRQRLESEKGQLEDILAQMGDSSQCQIELKYEILGEYIRVNPNQNGQIVLYNVKGQKTEKLIATYIHEMMHSEYDYNRNIPNNYVDIVEEPLTEFATLCHLEELDRQKGTQYFGPAIESIRNKQYCAAICHYGFGVYLFEEQTQHDWIAKMKAAKYKINKGQVLQTKYGQCFNAGIYPFKNEGYIVQELLTII